MCREAKLGDPELISSCKQIIGAQRTEITQMERIFSRLNR